MLLRSRRFRHDQAGPHIYSGAEAERRAAGTPPGWVEVQARWIRARSEGDGQAVALVGCCILVAAITALLWWAVRGC
jgi:hypothetical protein